MSDVNELLILNRRDLEGLALTWPEIVDVIEDAFRQKAQGLVTNPPKPKVTSRDDAFIHAMPAYLGGSDRIGLKWVSGYEQNHAKGLPYFSAKFLEFLPGLIHSGLKTIGSPVFMQVLRFLPQGLCLRQFRLRLVSFFLGLRLYGCAFVREPLVQFMRFNPGFFQHFLALGIGRAKYFARTLLGLGPHPIKIVFLLLVLHAFAAQGLLHGVKLLHGGFALTHEDSSPFFAQLI